MAMTYQPLSLLAGSLCFFAAIAGAQENHEHVANAKEELAQYQIAMQELFEKLSPEAKELLKSRQHKEHNYTQAHEERYCLQHYPRAGSIPLDNPE